MWILARIAFYYGIMEKLAEITLYYGQGNLNNRMRVFKHLIRILKHKYWVAYYCFQLGLYWQGIIHDWSKFSYTEFSRSIKYWDDKISSLANEKNINGYSETFLHHRGRNPHHYEYWIHSLDDGGIAAEMPKKYVIELICDYLAACKTYGSNPRNEYDWWKENKSKMKIHRKSKIYIGLVLKNYKNGYSLKESIKRVDDIYVKYVNKYIK